MVVVGGVGGGGGGDTHIIIHRFNPYHSQVRVWHTSACICLREIQVHSLGIMGSVEGCHLINYQDLVQLITCVMIFLESLQKILWPLVRPSSWCIWSLWDHTAMVYACWLPEHCGLLQPDLKDTQVRFAWSSQVQRLSRAWGAHDTSRKRSLASRRGFISSQKTFKIQESKKRKPGVCNPDENLNSSCLWKNLGRGIQESL